MQAPTTPADVASPLDTLLDAAGRGNIDRVRELLDEGSVGVNDAETWGYTALLCASGGRETKETTNGGHAAVVKLLLERGAEVDVAEYEYGCTPMNEAAQKGHTAILSLLLDHGGDVNHVCNEGGSPVWDCRT